MAESRSYPTKGLANEDPVGEDNLRLQHLLEEVIKVQARISNSFHLAFALDMACKATIDLLGARIAAVTLRFGDGYRMVSCWSTRGKTAITHPWIVPADNTITSECVRSGKLVQWPPRPHVSFSHEDDKEASVRLQSIGKELRSFACPLTTYDGITIGALVVSMDPDTDSTTEEITISEIVAAGISSALDANRSWEETLGNRATIAHQSAAQHIHDTIAQDTFALEFVLDKIEAICRGDSRVGEEVARAKDLCSAISMHVADMMREQQQGYMGSQDVIGLIEHEIDQAAQRSGVTFSLICDDEVDECVSQIARDTIVLAVREALLNAWKHSKPRSGFVRLYVRGGSVVLVVQNDGAGAGGDGIAQQRSSCFGLANLRNMAEGLSGRLDVDNDLDAGIFTLRMIVPVERSSIDGYHCNDR